MSDETQTTDPTPEVTVVVPLLNEQENVAELPQFRPPSRRLRWY
jgi:hypothetical protein